VSALSCFAVVQRSSKGMNGLFRLDCLLEVTMAFLEAGELVCLDMDCVLGCGRTCNVWQNIGQTFHRQARRRVWMLLGP